MEDLIKDLKRSVADSPDNITVHNVKCLRSFIEGMVHQKHDIIREYEQKEASRDNE